MTKASVHCWILVMVLAVLFGVRATDPVGFRVLTDRVKDCWGAPSARIEARSTNSWAQIRAFNLDGKLVPNGALMVV